MTAILPDTVSSDSVQLDITALLGLLGYRDDERVSVSHGVGKDFTSALMCFRDTAEYVATLPDDVNIYFGVNPIANVGSGRGKAEDVTRLAALWADLDFKSCVDLATAYKIVDDVSEVIGTRPSAITHSGHGIHPYWPIKDGKIGDTAKMAALLKRFGRLVKAVAKTHDAKADSVFDLPRILRLPGSNNCKQPDNAIPVVCYEDTGRPLTIAEIDERLTAAGSREQDGDGATERTRSKEVEWDFSNVTCPYMRTFVDGIPDEEPTGGRHPWVASQAVRLACAVRLGCITEADAELAEKALDARLRQLRNETGESTPELEVPSLMEFGIEKAEAKTDEEARAELGGHRHEPQEIDAEAFWASRETLRSLRQFARARRAGPWAVLGQALARALAAVPPHVVLPGLVGGTASLNLFVALVGESGSGKGVSARAAADWLSTKPSIYTATLGSGEGIAKVYAYKRKQTKDDGGGFEQVGLRYSVLFDAPEVDNLAALGSRSGATLLPQLRQAYSGEELGFTYADPTKAIRLCRHRYRLNLTVGVQPGRARALLDDADGGTPQRFVWLPVLDPDMPDIRPEEPPGLQLPDWDEAVKPAPHANGLTLKLKSGVGRSGLLDEDVTHSQLHVLKIPAEASEAIDATTVAKHRGQQTNDALDGHKPQTRLKVAAGLMWLDGRTDEITVQDWHLAGVIIAVSDRTRQAVIGSLSTQKTEANRARGRSDAEREAIKADVLEQRRIERIAARIVTKMQQETEGLMVNSIKKKFFSGTDKPFVDAAIDHLENSGKVAVEEISYNGLPGRKVTLRPDR